MRPVSNSGVTVGTSSGVGSVAGVVRCASVHVCPVCAPKIRNGRAQEINEAGLKHLGNGGGMLFVTLTVPHSRLDRLSVLLDAVGEAWKGVTRSRFWRDLGEDEGLLIPERSPAVGVIRSTEITHGVNGWHPHLHNLLFFDLPVTPTFVEWFTERLREEWAHQVVRSGLGVPSDAHGVDVRLVDSVDNLSTYVAGVDGSRFDLELARGDLKHSRRVGSRTPFGILSDLVEFGDTADRGLWWEYEAATKGRTVIHWSHRLKAFFGIGAQTDTELSESETGFVAVASLPTAVWRRVVAARAVPTLLDVVELHDSGELTRFLCSIGAAAWFVWLIEPESPDKVAA